MKRNYVYFLFTYLLTFVVSGCDTDIEPEVIQAANTYNEEYYQNLREYKKTDHAICFGWYAGYTSEASPVLIWQSHNALHQPHLLPEYGK